MELADLRSFVVEAHRNGYATSDPETDPETGEKVITYERDAWRYVDRYTGSRRYVGSEVVLRDGDPVWGMHYYGAPTVDVDHGPLYAFLRDALAAVSAESPFRGPDRFDDAGFTYRQSSEGSLRRFRGSETVERDDEEVYRGQFGGGLVE